MAKNRLMNGMYYIPEKVIFSLPSNSEQLQKYREYSISGIKDFNKVIGKSPLTYKCEDSAYEYSGLIPESELPTIIPINPKGEYNIKCIKKRNTLSNKLYSSLNFRIDARCELTELVVENKGWEITKVFSPDIFSSAVLPSYLTIKKDSIFLQVENLELTRKIERELGYNLAEENVCLVIFTSYSNLVEYLGEFNDELVYGKLLGKVRLLDLTVSDYFNAFPLMKSDILFVSEEFYQKYKETNYKLAVELGKSDSLIPENEPYKPGHLYRFIRTNKYLSVGSTVCNESSNSFYLLYVGKLSMSKFISTTAWKQHSLFSNNYIDKYDVAEFNEWSEDPEEAPRLGSDGYTLGELNIPVDVFLPFSTLTSRNECTSPIIYKSLTSGTCLSEAELCAYERKVFWVASKFRTDPDSFKKKANDVADVLLEWLDISTLDLSNKDEIYRFIRDELVPRFVVLPSISLLSSKKGETLESHITNRLNLKLRNGELESSYKTSYRHFVDVFDAGKYFTIESSAKDLMKKLILNAEGRLKNYEFQALAESYDYRQVYYSYGYPGTKRVLGLDSYDLFSEEDLSNLDGLTLRNLKNNLSELILNILLSYSVKFLNYKQFSSCYSTYVKNPFTPSFDRCEGLLKEIGDASTDAFFKIPAERRENSMCLNMEVNTELKKNLLDSIISVITDKKDRKLKYKTGGIISLINKYKLTEKDFKSCKQYQK